MLDKLNLVNPLNVLKRGYALPYKNDKIVGIEDINKNDLLTIKLHNGKIEVNVKEVLHEVWRKNFKNWRDNYVIRK
mgnify:CR=1 FL=1